MRRRSWGIVPVVWQNEKRNSKKIKFDTRGTRERPYLKMNPIIIPDTPYEVILTDGTILTGTTHDVEERYFFLDSTKVKFEDIHNFKLIIENFEQFKERKNEDTLIHKDDIKSLFQDSGKRIMDQLKTLKECLEDWTDFDIAEYYLAVCLGMIEDDERAFPITYKHVFWSANAVGSVLGDILDKLKDLGALEFDEEEIQYRWNKKFEVPKGWKKNKT
jgi:hypothetical protein